MNLMMIVVGLLFQQQVTPIPTPTPGPLDATAQALQAEYEAIEATAQAIEADQTLTTDGNQIYNNGSAVLPDMESSAMTSLVAYTKFVVDSRNTSRVFGPFAPIVNHIRFFSVLVLGWFAFYFGQQAISILYRFVLFVIAHLREVVIFIAFALGLWLLWWLFSAIYELWLSSEGVREYMQDGQSFILDNIRKAISSLRNFAEFAWESLLDIWPW